MSHVPADAHVPADPMGPARPVARRTRRALLVGGAGIVVLGAVGAGLVETDVLPGRQRFREFLGDRSPVIAVPSVRTGPRLTGRFVSKARQGRATAWVAAWPIGHRPGDDLPLVVTLHGFGDDHRAAFDSLHLDSSAAQAFAEGSPPFVIAAVDAGDGYFHERTAFGDSGAMISDELVPELVRHGVRERPYGLLGWSMGGYGALLLAERLGPGVSSTVVAESPALWTSVDRRNPRAFDSAADYRANDVWAARDRLARTAVRIDCGTADGFYPAVHRFAAALGPEPAGGFGDGGHDPAFWRSCAPAQVRWAAAHLSAH